MSSELELADGSWLALDEEGYLADWRAWSREAAESFAAAEGLELDEARWEVLNILRDFYAEFEIAPPMRALVKLLRERTGNDRLGSRELYRLFPGGPAKQAARIAGLPRPVSCI